MQLPCNTEVVGFCKDADSSPWISSSPGDWKNLCIMDAHNNLIDLSGDFEFTMDDYVEWLQQERDADSPLQTTTDLECEGENHISWDGNIVRDGDLFCDGDILCSGSIVCNSMIE